MYFYLPNTHFFNTQSAQKLTNPCKLSVVKFRALSQSYGRRRGLFIVRLMDGGSSCEVKYARLEKLLILLVLLYLLVLAGLSGK